MTGKGPVEVSMYNKLKTGLQPVHLELRNESYMHNVPKGSETHFKVVVVSAQFEGKPLIQVLMIIFFCVLHVSCYNFVLVS